MIEIPTTRKRIFRMSARSLLSMIDYQAGLRAIVAFMPGKMIKGHTVHRLKRARVGGSRVRSGSRTPVEIVVVPSAQYKRLTAADRPSEVPSALRELVLQSRSANAAQ